MTEDIQAQIEKLEVNDGDFVIIRGLTSETAYRVVTAVGAAIKQAGKKGVTVACIDSNQSIDVLDSGKMREAGWVRLN